APIAFDARRFEQRPLSLVGAINSSTTGLDRRGGLSQGVDRTDPVGPQLPVILGHGDELPPDEVVPAEPLAFFGVPARAVVEVPAAARRARQNAMPFDAPLAELPNAARLGLIEPRCRIDLPVRIERQHKLVARRSITAWMTQLGYKLHPD